MNIYIHIPFCHSKCAYCAFLSTTQKENVNKYLSELNKEIKSRDDFSDKIETIYFGGGTPSLIEPSEVEKIVELLKKRHTFSEDIEITLEANPEDINNTKLLYWKRVGITRLSIGIQTLNDEVRKVVGRQLAKEQVLVIVRESLKIFRNVGVDFIAGLPGDDLEGYLLNLKEIISLGVNHISLYDLEISRGSRFSNNMEKYSWLSESERINFLEKCWELLEKNGFEQYEISNFAKNRSYCNHNLDFWHGKDYIGFGLGAVSKVNNTIYNNTCDFEKYFKGGYVDSVERLSEAESRLITLANLVRLNHPLDKYLNKVKTHHLQQEGFLDDKFRVTKNGKLLNNYLLKEFL